MKHKRASYPQTPDIDYVMLVAAIFIAIVSGVAFAFGWIPSPPFLQ